MAEECIREFNSGFAIKCKGEHMAENNEPQSPPCPKASQSTEEGGVVDVASELPAGGRLHL